MAVPYAVVGPYSKKYWVVVPFGVMVPFSLADVAATLVAGSVVAVGVLQSEVVVKVASSP